MQTKTSKLLRLRGRHGFIMLALLLILVIAGSTYMLAGLNNRGSVYLEQQAELHRQLAEAKQNLLAYVANSNVFHPDNRGPGFFPCPDNNNDGLADSICNPVDEGMPVCKPDLNNFAGGPVPLLGRLPQYLLDASSHRLAINDHYASVDQQFWYVVAPRYVYDSTAAYRRSQYRTSTSATTSAEVAIGPACMRLFEAGDAQYVAFIIAPGEALETQDRAGSRALHSHYLDGKNGSDYYKYHTSYESNPQAFNDQIVGITLSEYLSAIGIRVAIETKKQLDAYHGPGPAGFYPASPADFLTALGTASSPAWLLPVTSTGNNGEAWSADITYTNISADESIISYSGCTGIAFKLNFIAGISRSGASC